MGVRSQKVHQHGKPDESKDPEEFKGEAVRLMLTRGERTVDEVADSLGVPTNLLHSWKKKYGDEIGIWHVRATETPEHAELRELRRNVKELEEEKTILKIAAAFFAKHSS
jgi:transposase